MICYISCENLHSLWISGCDVGHWGQGCESACHEACSDCDHRTGCCNSAKVVHERMTAAVRGLTFCAADTVATTGEPGDGSRVKQWFRTRGSQTTPLRDTSTTEPAAAVRNYSSTATAVQARKPAPTEGPDAGGAATEITSSLSLSKKRDSGGTFVHQTVTTMEVKVYNYDELVKKLVWISSMTVIAIAMVFVVMFVVFFNCSNVSGVPERTKAQRSTPSTTNKVHGNNF